MKKFLTLLCCLLFPQFASTLDLKEILGPQELMVGPEIYHIKRERRGGTKQDGFMYGAFFKYDRFKRCGFYWAGVGYATLGCLEGKSASGTTLKSDFNEYEVEGKLGWSFCIPICQKDFVLTPYCGYGYYFGKNDFSKPVQLPLTFRDKIEYFSTGFQTRLFHNERLSFGTIFTAKWMFEGVSRVTNDPFNDDAKLVMGNEMLYNFELPIIYKSCICSHIFHFHFTPFYRYRHYGSRENFPSDFIDTKFHIYGLQFSVNRCF